MSVGALIKRQAIRKWMVLHVDEHVDACNEVNTTSLTEAWDNACDSGEATLDSDHEAWEVAHEVAEWYEK